MNPMPTTRRPNGKGKAVQCPNAPECTVAVQAADTLAVIDGRLERLEEGMWELTRHVTRVSDESLDRARTYIESNDSILKMLERLRPREVEGA